MSEPLTAERAGSTPRLAAVVGGLLLALIAGFALGRAVTAPVTSTAGGSWVDHAHPAGTAPHTYGAGPTGPDSVGGLSLSAAGYTLVPLDTALPADRNEEFRFRVVGADRRPVTAFQVVHDRPMHVIVARRDVSGYQHLHPEMAADGTWSVPLRLPEPGIWRAYTDFTVLDPIGAPIALTLGVDLVVEGGYAPTPLPAPATQVSVAGYTVSVEGAPGLGAVAPLLFRVSRAGRPVTDLERYLGAYGHLVALRDGDLGYLHAHPEDRLAGDAAKFWLAAPSPGRYRLFLDFQVAGAVHTAAFTFIVA